LASCHQHVIACIGISYCHQHSSHFSIMLSLHGFHALHYDMMSLTSHTDYVARIMLPSSLPSSCMYYIVYIGHSMCAVALPTCSIYRSMLPMACNVMSHSSHSAVGPSGSRHISSTMSRGSQSAPHWDVLKSGYAVYVRRCLTVECRFPRAA